MAYTTYTDVRLLTNTTTSDISNADVTSIIAEATKELNAFINVRVMREVVRYIDVTRSNKRDSSNTTFYVQNWNGKYLADMNNDGSVTIADVIVYLVSTDGLGTETTPTISSIDASLGKIVLASPPSTNQNMYITYEWCYRNPSTPDPLIKLACTMLSSAYSWLKINTGMAPQQSWGNVRIYRDMDAFDTYYKRFINLVDQINNNMIDYSEAETI